MLGIFHLELPAVPPNLFMAGFGIFASQFKVTFESVRERERLLHEAPDLVTPLMFILPIYDNYQATRGQISFSLGLYDFFGRKRAHGELNEDELNQKAHLLKKNNLDFSFFYYDAAVDDSRLVIRNIQEGIEFGGTALNYVKVSDLLLSREGMVVGVVLHNCINDNQSKEVLAKVVVNATGPWSDELRDRVSIKKSSENCAAATSNSARSAFQ